MRVMDELKQGLEEVWESVAEGWQRLHQQTAGALTRFRAAENEKPSGDAHDDRGQRPGRWALLAGDVFENDRSIFVRLELPGLVKDDIHIEVRDDALTVRADKRFERESTEGRYRVLQCAYGAFTRQVTLPASVRAAEAKATYNDGVLRVELPKDAVKRSSAIDVPVA